MKPDGGAVVLVVAHPGHELRVHGWLEKTRPRVFVLTDGSGRSKRSRLGETTRLLDAARAERGAIYGRLTDNEAYARILDHDFSWFIALAEEVAEELMREAVSYVAGDAAEGYNPAHDVCRLVTNTAVALATRRLGRPIRNYDFTLVGAPDQCPVGQRDDAIRLRLDDAALARKMAAARAYSALTGEVDAALRELGEEAFRTECLRLVGSVPVREWHAGEAPFYERHGERRVTSGAYSRVLRFREHVLPLGEALDLHAEARA
jgi:hypothetical protein